MLSGCYVLVFSTIFSLAYSQPVRCAFALRGLTPKVLEVSVLLVVFNKGHYLNRAFSSILTVFEHTEICYEVVCVNDASTDNSSAVLRRFQDRDQRVNVHTNARNLGTFISRNTAVLLARAPFLVFLDPDDELTGNGVPEALRFIRKTNADIVEFGCLSVTPKGGRQGACWKTPPVTFAAPKDYRELFYGGLVNCHVHRKVIRRSVYVEAIRSMPDNVRRKRMVRFDDKLAYAFIVNHMTRGFHFLPVLGELRYDGLPDNSQSGTYQTKAENNEENRYVTETVLAVFHRRAK